MTQLVDNKGNTILPVLVLLDSCFLHYLKFHVHFLVRKKQWTERKKCMIVRNSFIFEQPLFPRVYSCGRL